MTPVTTPELATVATDVFDDCQVACEETFWVVLFDKVAVAVNCAEAPTVGALPVTATDEVVGLEAELGVVGVDEDVLVLLLPHAHTKMTKVRATAVPAMIRRIN